MNDDLKNKLFELLDTLGYTDDKEAFAKEFINYCYQQTLLDLVQTLSADKQQAFQQEMSSASEANANEIVKKYFSEDQYEQGLKNSVESLVKEYVRDLMPDLTEEQKQKLQAFATSQQQE